MSSESQIETWHPLADGNAPDWASGWGEDRLGPFVELRVNDAVQLLRWIPPGNFRMGSPDDEPGRFPDRESPVHVVNITRGFWMFDTLCTQKLWVAVMGENPSRFKHPERPVERVSWEDVQCFVERMRTFPCTPTLSLPTEAEWEYACRAGTSTATYAGPMEILGQNHAPVLDEIAWYGGNCGVGFDLDDGASAANWPEKQYKFNLGGTRVVGTRAANPWGLYDMLGNVLEWCRDGLRSYEAGEVTDPLGAVEASAQRVVRGGSWDDGARPVRAAYRSAYPPGYRIFNLGFRCRVQERER